MDKQQLDKKMNRPNYGGINWCNTTKWHFMNNDNVQEIWTETATHTES